MTTATAPRRPEVARFAWLAAALGLAAAPHLLRLPGWVAPALALTLAWRYRIEAAGGRPPPRPVPVGLGLAAILLAGLTNPRVVHQDTFVTVLVALGGLKLLESRGARDDLVALFLGAFLLFVHFLNAQEIGPALYGLGAATTLLAAMNAVAAPSERPRIAARLGLALRLAAQAAPLTLALFLLFPRVAGRQWSLTPGPAAAVTGLSDRLEPGAVSRLARSGEVAFRATFEGGAAPPPAQRYWRGPVLEEGDGLSWRQAPAERTGTRPPRPPARVALVRHEVTLEPQGRPWLLALDVPLEPPAFAVQTPGLTLLARRPLRERLRYRVASATPPPPASLDQAARAHNLAPPRRPSARVVALARQLRSGARDDRAVVAALLAHLQREPFGYTLAPPPLGADPLDEFLFATRKGFCEHYAAAGASLLRLAGVPARVVTGYLGGEHNPLGDYWVVRQSDAHAWCEAWLGDRGWVRVDPTAAVAPERVEAGLGALEGAEGPLGLPRGGPMGSLGLALWRGWDALANGWNQWFLGYDELRQRLLLERLGYRDPTPWGLALTLAAVGSGALGLVALRLALGARRARDPAQAAYARFCARLARAGLPRRPHEGPLAYAERVARARPDLGEPALRIAFLYAGLRYGPPVGARQTAAALRAEVRRFSTRRR